jgi:hypothetical protein
LKTNKSNLISLADASAATLERLTDRFGLILAEIAAAKKTTPTSTPTRQEQFKILEARISHILLLQEQAAAAGAGTGSGGVAA